MTPIYLDRDECLVLLQALAYAVDPIHEPPADATECSRVVWNAEHATPVQRSLSTALAEASYGPYDSTVIRPPQVGP